MGRCSTRARDHERRCGADSQCTRRCLPPMRVFQFRDPWHLRERNQEEVRRTLRWTTSHARGGRGTGGSSQVRWRRWRSCRMRLAVQHRAPRADAQHAPSAADAEDTAHATDAEDRAGTADAQDTADAADTQNAPGAAQAQDAEHTRDAAETEQARSSRPATRPAGAPAHAPRRSTIEGADGTHPPAGRRVSLSWSQCLCSSHKALLPDWWRDASCAAERSKSRRRAACSVHGSRCSWYLTAILLPAPVAYEAARNDNRPCRDHDSFFPSQIHGAVHLPCPGARTQSSPLTARAYRA